MVSPDVHAHGHGYADAYTHDDTHPHAHGNHHTDAHGDFYTHTYRFAHDHLDADRNANVNAHTDDDGNANDHRDSHHHPPRTMTTDLRLALCPQFRAVALRDTVHIPQRALARSARRAAVVIARHSAAKRA